VLGILLRFVLQWRLEWAKSKIPGLETLDYTRLSKGQTVNSKLLEMVPGGVDACLDCTLAALSRDDGRIGDGYERDYQ